MSGDAAFAERIRERYPEGLTCLLALGGTRTAYILERNRHAPDPGRIDSMRDYARYGLDRLQELLTNFFELGGQNIVVSVLSYQQMHDERGAEYSETTAKLALVLMSDEWIAFYQRLGIDPYFTGIDTLLHLPQETPAYQLGEKCRQFHAGWAYQQGRRRILWEIAPIPLFSLWKAHTVMGDAAQAALAEEIEQSRDLQTLHDCLYRYYARAVYGTDLPIPHFYLGTNRNGVLKLRSVLPVALLCGGPFRLFYTPYPSLLLTRDVLRAMLEDLAFGKPVQSSQIDYREQYASETLEAEYARVQELVADPVSAVGFVRRMESEE